MLRDVTVLEPSSPPAGHQSASTLATGGVEVFAAVDFRRRRPPTRREIAVEACGRACRRSTSSLRSCLTQATFICRLLIVQHDVLARHGFAAKSATEDRSDIGTARRMRQGRVRFRRA